MADKRTYCGKPVPDDTGIYLDESGVDGVFCDNGVCTEAFVFDMVETVANEG